MNNARYFELIDTAVNAHLAEATGVDIRSLPAIGVVAEVGCRYFREIGYPEPVDMGMVVDKVGTSSVVYRIGLFQGSPEGEGAEAAAEGRFVHVYVDNTGDRVPGGRSARSPSRSARPSYPCCETDHSLEAGPSTRSCSGQVRLGTTNTLHRLFPDEGAPMGAIVVVLLLALVLAAVVMVYAAYPYRGEETPVTPRSRRRDATRRATRCRPWTATSKTARRPAGLRGRPRGHERTTSTADLPHHRFDWIAA